MDILVGVMNSLANLDMDRTFNLVKEAFEHGFKPLDIVNALAEGMEIVGERYERDEYFVSELIIAAEIFKQAMELFEPLILK